jgi:hypothetical protein
MRYSYWQRIFLYAHNSRCGFGRCLHGWPPNVGTENPTWRIPVNPHIGSGEQDIPGNRHCRHGKNDRHDDVADQASVGGGVHVTRLLRAAPRGSSPLAAIRDYG